MLRLVHRSLAVRRLAHCCPTSYVARCLATKSASLQPELAVEDDGLDTSAIDATSSSAAPRRQRRGSAAAQKPEVIVHRPTIRSFSKPGFGKDLVKHLQDFPHALLLCRVGQFYEVCLRQDEQLAPCLKVATALVVVLRPSDRDRRSTQDTAY